MGTPKMPAVRDIPSMLPPGAADAKSWGRHSCLPYIWNDVQGVSQQAGMPTPHGSSHDSNLASSGDSIPVAWWPGFFGNRSGTGLQPRVGHPIWPHRLGAVLSLSVRVVSAEVLE